MFKEKPNIYNNFINYLVGLSRKKKTLLLMLVDYGALIFCFELSLSIRINELYWPTEETRILILLAPMLAIPIFYLTRLYQSFIRFAFYHNLKIIIIGVTIYTFTWFLIVLIPELVVKPYDFLVINWLLTVFFIVGIRYMARLILTKKLKSTVQKNVLIYGAGDAGSRLESVIRSDPSIYVGGFIDDNRDKQGLFIEDKKVYKPENLDRLIHSYNINEILVAMPSLPKSDLQKILQSLSKYPVVLKTLPDIADLVRGTISVSDLKKIRIEDLLSREVRAPDQKLLQQDINNKNILITGAGGSIGSEICRQVINQEPKMLILFEINEHALYLIERELKERDNNIPILAVLGDVTNNSRLKKIFQRYNVQTIYHTAAYKHVPMVEKNTIAATKCNIFGTYSVISAAVTSKVESFVFISTDKAVRPTNTMGATKRFAEMILQSYRKYRPHTKSIMNTRISIVRFGNVLGSSGSVVPLFTEQIKKGGPVTVTDPEMIRYFMTIQEAAQLVIQAGAIGGEGEIFLLDMGEPKKVLDLAKSMIKMSGLSIKDKDNSSGDIEIIYTGMRAGEKLYEELLIENSAIPTQHKKIFIADDKSIEWKDIERYLEKLEEAENKVVDFNFVPRGTEIINI